MKSSPFTPAMCALIAGLTTFCIIVGIWCAQVTDQIDATRAALFAPEKPEATFADIPPPFGEVFYTLYVSTTATSVSSGVDCFAFPVSTSGAPQ
jgi:hypothetical protein